MQIILGGGPCELLTDRTGQSNRWSIATNKRPLGVVIAVDGKTLQRSNQTQNQQTPTLIIVRKCWKHRHSTNTHSW
ncbi:hypothetical protein CA13_15940 [Planctomycetes bacterium CA13]|uniref:Uncharacterized protein n=1 Tax=Novipirellula herctigrandis TaxID=2527986 RepID=A0A5C5Z032_9BACT|nr:hypothetical protein CA13_15940 [Planctomycetes bacterium CA13]